MKRLLPLLLLFLALSGYAQQLHYPMPVDLAARRTVVDTVVAVEGATKAELYSRAREWVAQYFVSSRAVLDMDDAASGKLIAEGHSLYTPLHSLIPNAGRLWRTIKIEVRDGRFRCQISDFYFGQATSPATSAAANVPLDRLMFSEKQYDNQGNPRRILENVAGGAKAACQEDIASLSKAMLRASEKGKSW